MDGEHWEDPWRTLHQAQTTEPCLPPPWSWLTSLSGILDEVKPHRLCTNRIPSHRKQKTGSRKIKWSKLWQQPALKKIKVLALQKHVSKAIHTRGKGCKTHGSSQYWGTGWSHPQHRACTAPWHHSGLYNPRTNCCFYDKEYPVIILHRI